MKEVYMTFELIVSFFLVGILPTCFLFYSNPKSYSKPKSAILSFLFLIFPCVVFFFYYKTTGESPQALDIILGSILCWLFNWQAFQGKIGFDKLIKSAVVIALFFLSSFVQIIPISLFHITSSNLTPAVETYLTLFSDTFLAIVLIYLYYDDLKKGILELKKNFNQLFDVSFRYWFLGFLGMMGSNLLIQLVAPQAVAGNEQAVQGMIDVSPWIMLICAGILAPIIEEITFRKAFQDIFRSPTFFVLASGIVFGSLHVVFAWESFYDFLYILPYASLGTSFAYMLHKTKNITSSIMMHILHNSMIILLSILTGMIIR